MNSELRRIGRRVMIAIIVVGLSASELSGQTHADTVSDEFHRAPTLADALTARYPGVSVLQSSGIIGAGAAVRLRGMSAVRAPNEPLLMVDGVWVHASQSSMTVDVGAAVQASRLDDIDPDDVERIDILPGPVAAALYGVGAARGVIRITTRRGGAGERRVRAFTEGGTIRDVASYPTNYATFSAPPWMVPCYIRYQAIGCVIESASSWNAIENASPYRGGSRLGTGVSASGGSDALTYALSASHDRDRGVYVDNEAARTRLRARAGTRIGGTDLSLSAAHATGMIQFPGGVGQASMLAAGLLGPGTDDPINRGYDPILREMATRTRSEQDFDHSTVAVHADWGIGTRWAARSAIGVDDARREESQHRPQTNGEEVFDHVDHFVARGGFRTVTASTAATATMNAGNLRASTTFGLEFRRERQSESRVNVNPATPPDWCEIYVSGCAFFVANEHLRATGSTTGLIVQQRLAWREQLQVDAGVRVDHGSIRGADIDALVSSSLSAAYTIPRTTAGIVPGLSSIVLRAGYGRAHDHRGIFAPGSVSSGGWNEFPLTNALEPEQITEVEAGFDIGAFGDRGALGVTAFRTDTRGGIISVPYPYSTGFRSAPGNGIDVRTIGVEATLRARVVDRSPVQWDVRISGMRHQNRIEHIRGATVIGWGMQQYGFVDHALSSYWGGASTWADANGDGMIVSSEILARGDPTIEYGPTSPTTEFGLATNLRLFGTVTAGALLDYRGGHQTPNLTAAARCATREVCRENHDPTSPIEDQAHAMIGLGGPDQGYVRDGDFVKLREISLGVRIPAALARVVGRSATLTFVGRNLATWTDYTGLDPEVTSNGVQSPARYDLFAQPLPRSLTARLDLSW